MNFFQRLFGIRPDPTKDWPPTSAPAPVFHLQRKSAGSIRFGTPFTDAQTFGRPDHFKGDPAKSCDLLYARAGYELEYEGGGLVALIYFVGPDEYGPTHEALTYSRPMIALDESRTHELHADSNAEALVEIFGTPESADVDEDESILVWELGDFTVEAELNPQSRLKRLNIYLTE
jgi:hypothetical protein